MDDCNLKVLIFQAPLVCKVADRWYVAGMVSWGINCGYEIPGVYMNVNKYIDWIQNLTRAETWN